MATTPSPKDSGPPVIGVDEFARRISRIVWEQEGRHMRRDPNREADDNEHDTLDVNDVLAAQE